MGLCCCIFDGGLAVGFRSPGEGSAPSSRRMEATSALSTLTTRPCMLKRILPFSSHILSEENRSPVVRTTSPAWATDSISHIIAIPHKNKRPARFIRSSPFDGVVLAVTCQRTADGYSEHGTVRSGPRRASRPRSAPVANHWG